MHNELTPFFVNLIELKFIDAISIGWRFLFAQICESKGNAALPLRTHGHQFDVTRKNTNYLSIQFKRFSGIRFSI